MRMWERVNEKLEHRKNANRNLLIIKITEDTAHLACSTQINKAGTKLTSSHPLAIIHSAGGEEVSVVILSYGS